MSGTGYYNREKYLTTYAGQKLLKEHNLDEWGIWEIFGEDEQTAFNGNHNIPYLGKVEGTLGDVIDEAVKRPNFWQWGSGGTIQKIPSIGDRLARYCREQAFANTLADELSEPA